LKLTLLKKGSYIVFYTLIFIVFLISFAPKRFFYYKLEHILSSKQIIISNEDINEETFWITISNGDVIIKDIPVGKFKSLKLYPDILINAIKLENFFFNKNLSILPSLRINRLYIYYSPFYPFKIVISGKSNIGLIKGSINLKQHRGVINIFSSHFLPLKKIGNGKYRYEFTY